MTVIEDDKPHRDNSLNGHAVVVVVDPVVFVSSSLDVTCVD